MFNSAAFSAPPFRKARVCVCWCPDLRNGKLLSKQSYVVTGWTLVTVQLYTRVCGLKGLSHHFKCGLYQYGWKDYGNREEPRIFVNVYRAVGLWENLQKIYISRDMLDDRQSGSPCFLLAGSFFLGIFPLLAANETIWRHVGKCT